MKRDDVPTRVPGHQKASAAVTAALGTLQYPISKQEAIARVGDWQIPYDVDTKVDLGTILQGVPQEDFSDVSQAARIVDQHWGRISRTLNELERVQAQANARRRRG